MAAARQAPNRTAPTGRLGNMTDPAWPRASEWLADRAPSPDLVVAGVPSSVASISPSEARQAPAAFRAILSKFSVFDGEREVDLRKLPVRDDGDLTIGDGDMESSQAEIRRFAEGLEPGPVRVFVGGDNAITRPLVAGLARGNLARVGVITFDAHHDVRALDWGPTNGTPIRGLIEEGLFGRNVVQIGIHTFANSPQYRAWCEEQGIAVTTLHQVEDWGIDEAVRRAVHRLETHCDWVYVDFDIDVLDRAYAPACPGSRPGGLTPRQLARAAFACGLHPIVKAADLVEVDPTTDESERTLMAMGLTFLSFAAGVAGRQGLPR